MSDMGPYKTGFPPIRPKNLIRLAEDLLHASSIPVSGGYHPPRTHSSGGLHLERYIGSHLSPISATVSRHRNSRTDLSPREEVDLEERLRKIVSGAFSEPRSRPMLNLPLRLHAHALLRESLVFPGIELCDESPDCSPNGFADIWKGDYHGQSVCIKVIRTQDSTALLKIKSVYHLAIEGGKHDPHPNVLPVIEVSETLFPLCIMSPWMLNGNIAQYTQKNLGANRLTLLAQACRGLMYLHGLDIIHGNIAPNNILITQDGQACLGEFGITRSFLCFNIMIYGLATLRYLAPECLPLEHLEWGPNGHSKESDVYSLAVTSFSILTGVLPYDGCDHREICSNVKGGVRPPRPTDPSRNQWLQDPIWNTLRAGWHQQSEQRCKLPVMYRAFLTSSHQGVQGTKTGESNARNGKVPYIETGLQQRGNFLPRITSFFQSLRDSGSKIQRRVDEIDKHLEDDTVSDRKRRKLFNKLCKKCSQNRVVPNSMNIPDCSEGSVEVECGGFANVSQSTYEGRRVAVKVVRMYVTSDLDAILSRFCREGVAWKHLRHPNILPLLGVTVGEYRFALVSEWMENGNINDFTKGDRNVNRTELLVDIANGLKYMHDLRVVHGDLKGANILITGGRRACIADFGLSTITGVATAAGPSRASLISIDTLMSFTGGGTRRWMGPELLDPERFRIPESENNRPTRQSDCYALGMVIYEVLCGHHPYLEIPSDIMAVNAIMEGVRPNKPEGAKQLGFSDDMWRTVEQCWLEDRNARPRVDEILSSLNDGVLFWNIWGL